MIGLVWFGPDPKLAAGSTNRWKWGRNWFLWREEQQRRLLGILWITMTRHCHGALAHTWEMDGWIDWCCCCCYSYSTNTYGSRINLITRQTWAYSFYVGTQNMIPPDYDNQKHVDIYDKLSQGCGIADVSYVTVINLRTLTISFRMLGVR